MSFKDARDALVLYHDNGVIDDEELLTNWSGNVYLWRSSISPLCSSAKTISIWIADTADAKF